MKPWQNGKLKVASNGRYLEHSNRTPFFYMGDTGWLLFGRLTTEEADMYLEDRRRKGFNVIQVMAVHKIPYENIYGDSAFFENDITRPQPEYWNHVRKIILMAEAKGLYMAIVCVWGSIVHDDMVSVDAARKYAKFLVDKLGDLPNIIWINGGDIDGSLYKPVWQALGETLRIEDKSHLITFHPIGRTQSSQWFHNEKWLDFNMNQSGHRAYTPDEPNDENYGEDNWRYILDDLSLAPIKPTIDAEPSYEYITHGLLHDASVPRWTAKDCRRYGYWSVFAGAMGYTYGHNAVMQMYKPQYSAAYACEMTWEEGLKDIGSGQMLWLRNLIERFPYWTGKNNQSILCLDDGYQYKKQLVFSSSEFTLIYLYTGVEICLKINSSQSKDKEFIWYNPRNGEYLKAHPKTNNEKTVLIAPDNEDWVLAIYNKDNKYFDL